MDGSTGQAGATGRPVGTATIVSAIYCDNAPGCVSVFPIGGTRADAWHRARREGWRESVAGCRYCPACAALAEVGPVLAAEPSDPPETVGSWAFTPARGVFRGKEQGQ